MQKGESICEVLALVYLKGIPTPAEWVHFPINVLGKLMRYPLDQIFLNTPALFHLLECFRFCDSQSFSILITLRRYCVVRIISRENAKSSTIAHKIFGTNSGFHAN